jgi:hypothetical protein
MELCRLQGRKNGDDNQAVGLIYYIPFYRCDYNFRHGKQDIQSVNSGRQKNFDA